MELVLGMMLATVLLVGVGERIRRPYPVLVLLLGAVVALLPGMPRLRIDPNLILPLFLPPLIFAAAQRITWRLLWDRRRSVVLLAGVLVLVTVVAVWQTARAIVPGITGAAAVALGALAAPPDPVATESVAGPLGLPRRLVTTLQAEGLCNDATALVVYGLATQFITGGRYPLWEAVPRFGYEAAVGVAAGIAVAWISRWLLTLIPETTARSGLTLIVPFACYLLADAGHASGVLAVLAAGLFLGRSGDDEAGVADRLSGGAFWDTVELLITGAAFALIGLELREVLDTHTGIAATVGPAVVVCAVIFAVRLVWMLVGGPIARRIAAERRTGSRNWREDLVMAWCGMRGLATIALALALPSATPVRGTLLLITFTIILATLVLPGLTLPWLVSLLGVHSDPSAREAAIRALGKRAGKAALTRLRELDSAEDLPAEVSEILRRRQRALEFTLEGDVDDPDYHARIAERAGQIKRVDEVYAEMLAAARREILTARTEPGADPAAADDVLRRLDLRSAHLL
jgi:monovalent cation/hydrogen antiporter